MTKFSGQNLHGSLTKTEMSEKWILVADTLRGKWRNSEPKNISFKQVRNNAEIDFFRFKMLT